MLKPANAFDTEKRVWFLLDNVVAYDEEHDVALRQGSGRRRASSPARFFLWSHWLNGPNDQREQIGTVTGYTLDEALEKASKRLEREGK